MREDGNNFTQSPAAQRSRVPESISKKSSNDWVNIKHDCTWRTDSAPRHEVIKIILHLMPQSLLMASLDNLCGTSTTDNRKLRHRSTTSKSWKELIGQKDAFILIRHATFSREAKHSFCFNIQLDMVCFSSIVTNEANYKFCKPNRQQIHQ